METRAAPGGNARAHPSPDVRVRQNLVHANLQRQLLIALLKPHGRPRLGTASDCKAARAQYLPFPRAALPLVAESDTAL